MPYSTAQICLNGHCISDAVDRYPEGSQTFCEKCGAKTITECPNCGTKIKGSYYEEDASYIGFSYHKPAYCQYCGSPFPWTRSALEAAAELIKEDEGLPAIEQERLLEILPDIISETPKTNLAVARIKKVFVSIGSFAADGLGQFAIDFGCELAKKQLGL